MVGSPESVADQLEAWVRDTDVDVGRFGSDYRPGKNIQLPLSRPAAAIGVQSASGV
jgi:alkanesulfonate monooxygenase SsuD/methylene tetrahydromethanopterin reductase-like flavin-dependent oxidoreductase (luciferase family)